MSDLQIVLLGSFQVTYHDQPVAAFESDKVRALLAYLAVEVDQPHHRETLAALLWPDMPETAARSNLRHALVNLRRAIHDYDATPPYLHITRQTIQFNRDSQSILDAAPFLSDIDGPPTDQQREEMIARYRGEFLTGFSVDDSTAFEEWAVVKREQCRRRMLSTLRELAEAYTQRGQYEQALPFARQRIELDPWDEAAHQQLIQLLALTDQRCAALAQYENCRRILQAELGVAPTAVTTTLYQNIRDEIWPDETARLPLPAYLVKETEGPLRPSSSPATRN